jgi:hypothetical protein
MSTSEIVIEGSRFISAFLREAKFLNWPVWIIESGERSPAEIVTVLDENPRAENSKRSAQFRRLKDIRGNIEPQINIEVFGPKRLLVFEADAHENSQSGTIEIPVPAKARLVTRRSSERRGAAGVFAGEGIVFDRENIAKARIELFDRSDKGFGLIIGIDSEKQLKLGCFVLGKLISGEESLLVNGEVVRLSYLGDREGSSNSLKFYKVGVSVSNGANSTHALDSTGQLPEQRINSRFQSRLGEKKIANLSLGKSAVRCKVLNSSSLGLRFVPVVPSDIEFFRAGDHIQVASIDPIFEVCSVSSHGVSAKVRNLTFGEALPWLEEATADLSEGLAENSADAQQILSLFIRAGAVSDSYLEAQKNFKDKVVGEGAPADGLIYKWVQRNLSGEILGHVACFQYADRIWQFSDLAGSKSSSNDAMGENFVRNFFRALAEVGSVSTPVPFFQMIFLSGHPFWKTFVAELERVRGTAKCRYVLGAKYFRFVNMVSRVSSFEDLSACLRPISGRDVQKITATHIELAKSGLAGLAEDLDFEAKSYGSSWLRQKKVSFRREYYWIDWRGFEGLVVLSDLSAIESVNQNPNVTWFLATKVGPDLAGFAETLGFFASSKGYHSPGVLVLSNWKDAGLEGTKNLVVTTFHPELLLTHWKRCEP